MKRIKNILRIAQEYSLLEELENFLYKKIEEKSSIFNPCNFSFYGDYRTCENKEPHPPHIHEDEGYETVRYGFLNYFCCGKHGKNEHGDLKIIVTHESPSSAECPAEFNGYWFLQ